MDIIVRVLLPCLFILAVGIRSAAQVPDSDIERRAKELLDSMNYYKLTNPARTIQIGDAFLNQVLEKSRKNILLIAKEAMHNIAKYSGAANASIGLSLRNGCLDLEIRDNGKGFSPSVKKSGNGLRNMQLRTEDLSGHFQLESGEQRGTRIHCEIPITSIRDMHGQDHP